MYYAVYQSGTVIYGVGETIEAAIAEAQEWIDRDASTITFIDCNTSGEVEGEMYVRRCSRALARAVNKTGGDVHYCLDAKGILRIMGELKTREHV